LKSGRRKLKVQKSGSEKKSSISEGDGGNGGKKTNLLESREKSLNTSRREQLKNNYVLFLR